MSAGSNDAGAGIPADDAGPAVGDGLPTPSAGGGESGPTPGGGESGPTAVARSRPAPGGRHSGVAAGRDARARRWAVPARAGVVRVSVDVSAVPARPVGAGQYTLALVSALVKRPVEVTLICRHGDDGRWTMVAPGAQFIPAAPLHRPIRPGVGADARPLVLRRHPVDVHHGPHYTMPEIARLPRVVTIHDLTFFDHPEWHERSKVPVFRRAIQRRAAARPALSASARTPPIGARARGSRSLPGGRRSTTASITTASGRPTGRGG